MQQVVSLYPHRIAMLVNPEGSVSVEIVGL